VNRDRSFKMALAAVTLLADISTVIATWRGIIHLYTGALVFLCVAFLAWALYNQFENTKLRDQLNPKKSTPRYYKHRRVEVVLNSNGAEHDYVSVKRSTMIDMVANDETPEWKWEIVGRSSQGIPFSERSAELSVTSMSRSTDGTIRNDGLRYNRDRLTHVFTFDPPLKKGEEFILKAEVEIENYCAANKFGLTQRGKAMPDTQGIAEFVSVKISYYHDLFEFLVDIPLDLQTENHHVEVVKNSKLLHEEMAYINQNGCISIAPQTNGSIRMYLRRELPPVGVTYRLCWRPQDKIEST